MASARPDQRRQLHGAVKLDQVDMHALGGKVLAGSLQVFAGYPQSSALAHGQRVVETVRHGDHHPALGDLQVERLVQTLDALLVQSILAGDPQISRTIANVGRNIGRRAR